MAVPGGPRRTAPRPAREKRSEESAMQVTIGTFNLNNLFSRFDFSADVSTADASDVQVEERTAFSFDDPSGFKLRTYQGRLVRGKPEKERKLIAARIKRMDLDVLAVQEVEDIDTLRQFVHEDLGGLYRHVVLIEGNDPRLIDIGLLSKLPLGGVTSWQHTPDPDNPGAPVFSRDLLQVDVLSADRGRRLFTVFNNHLKSHFVPFNAPDPAAEQDRANQLRRRQCEAAATIVAAQTRPTSSFLVVGDMNDPPDSPIPRAPGQRSQAQAVVRPRQRPRDPPGPRDGPPNPKRPPGPGRPREPPRAPGAPPPPTAVWPERFKPPGQPAVYPLRDQVWLTPPLAAKQTAAFIDRRTKVGGDGSDHDP